MSLNARARRGQSAAFLLRFHGVQGAPLDCPTRPQAHHNGVGKVEGLEVRAAGGSGGSVRRCLQRKTLPASQQWWQRCCEGRSHSPIAPPAATGTLPSEHSLAPRIEQHLDGSVDEGGAVHVVPGDLKRGVAVGVLACGGVEQDQLLGGQRAAQRSGGAWKQLAAQDG